MNVTDEAIQHIGTAIGAGAGAGGGFFMFRWFFDWIGGRVDKREAAAAAAMARVDAATAVLVENLQEQLNWHTRRMAAVEMELESCRDQHIEAREEIARLRGTIQGWGDARQKAQLILSAERNLAEVEKGDGTV